MRITNSMIRNNTSNNMSTNKGYVDTLNTQMSTQKRLTVHRMTRLLRSVHCVSAAV